jgi:dTDP-4-amino-4,6-dideoxygalactose transaminase
VERIPLVDLAAQHAPLLPALEAAAARVLASNRFVLGAELAAFEREAAAALGVTAAVGVSSGTDALICLLLAAGVAPGDEVLTTPYSFFATAEAIARVGARPVFADVDPRTLNLDPTSALERIGRQTRAVLVVHLFGRAARLDSLAAVCAAKGIALVEDAAQSIGATVDSRPVGTFGIGAALSFFPAKNLGGFGDGGMVLTGDAAIADRVRRLRNHGADRKHHHLEAGGNFRLDELQAALLRVKLPSLSAWTAARRRVAAAYRQRLDRSPVSLPPPDDGCVWNQFVVRVPGTHRDALAAWLAETGVETAVHYPLPLHLQPALAYLGYQRGDFPDAERAAADSLALPIFPEMTDAQIDAVAGAIGAYFTSGRGAAAL